MKQFLRSKKNVLITFSLIGTFNVYAMSSLNLTCPEKYIATVMNVEDVAASAFPKVEVDFQIIQTLKGEKILSKKLQVVKDGPIHFKSGEVYTLEANNQWLCSATLFSKI